MPEKSRATLPREVTDHRERTELTETGPSDPQRFAERSIHFMVRTLPTLTPSSPRGGLPLRSSCFGIASAPPGPSLHVKGPSGGQATLVATADTARWRHPGRPFWTEASDTEALNCGQPASCCREIGPRADASAPSFRNRSARAGTGAGMGVA